MSQLGTLTLQHTYLIQVSLGKYTLDLITKRNGIYLILLIGI
jgi:hypothetical protein